MFDGIPVGNISAGALLGLVILMILTDRLVTRKRLEDSQRETENWRQVAEVSQAQTAKLLENSELTVALLRSIKDHSGGGV